MQDALSKRQDTRRSQESSLAQSSFANAATSQKVAVIIPAYKVTAQICDLIDRIGDGVDAIYVVDDCCPDGSGKLVKEKISDPRVSVLYTEENSGVGGAVITGFLRAQADGMNIGVKLDGDGQMDPSIIHKFVAPIITGNADYTKGNRFFTPRNLGAMPPGRIFGNAILSFVSKFSTGYWNLFDPTNGYIALNLSLLEYLSLEQVDKRYFFETDMLFRCNLIRAKVVDVPMLAIYEGEKSNLKAGREAFRFVGGHSKNFVKRIAYNYFFRDFNIGSIELVLGFFAIVFGVAYGLIHLGGPEVDSAGTVMMAALPTIIGVFLLVSFLNFDVQQTPRESIARFL
ncbi:MAG: glycosyltransferase family 2 protein [Pseudomonadota bacterium]